MILAPKGAIAVKLFSETPAGAPPPKDGVPTGEPHPWGHVLHDVFEVVYAPAGVDSRPAEEVPFGQVFPKLVLHVEGGEFP